MDYSKEQLVDALYAEYVEIIREGEEELEMTLEVYHDYLKGLSYDELIYETGTDDDYLISDFMYGYS
jgi:hypothetical protein